MKGKKLLSFLAVLMVWLLVASSALAVTIDHDTSEVYGDGDAIVVRGSDDGSKTTVNDFEDDVTGYNIYGGSRNANVESTDVTIEAGAVVGDVYGGGHAEGEDDTGADARANVTGSTNVVIEEGATTGDVYGGGHAEGGDSTAQNTEGGKAVANVAEETNVTVNGGTTGDVYGGGNAQGGDSKANGSEGGDAKANVGDQASVTVNGGNTGSVHGGGKSDKGERKKGTPGSATAKVDSTSVEVNGGEVDGNVYGGGQTSQGNSNVKNDADVKVGGGTVTGDVYGGGRSTALLGSAQVGNDAQVTIAGGTVKGAVYSSGDDVLGGLLAVEGESRIIIEGGKIESGIIFANHANTRIDLKDTSAFYYTYYVRPFSEDFQILIDILEEYPLTKVGCEGLYWVYKFQGVEAPRTVDVVFQYMYNGAIIDTVTKTVTVEFFQTAEKGRGVTVESAFAGDNLYKPASGSATVYFNSEQVTVPVELERYPRDNDNDDDDDDVPLNPGLVPGAEDIPLGVPSTGGLTDWSILIAALGFAGVIAVRELRRKKV